MTTVAYLALGSNLGDRRHYLQQALERLGQTPRIEVRQVSTFLETTPVGGPPGQGLYLNAVAEIATDLSAEQLLPILLDLETQLGRVRQERFGPRTLDLDLLLHGQSIVHIDRPDLQLQVPHPRLHERSFVLIPLVEIAPLAVHPVLQSTARDLLRRLEGSAQRELLGLKALVTGSTSGIGRAIALELARGGADVLVHGVRSPEHAAAVAGEVRSLGVASEPLMADLRDEAGLLRFAEAAWCTWNGLDIWINNAGADTLTGEAARWPFERKLEELWRVDVKATMLLARAIGARLKQRGGGVLVNMGWDQAETGMAGDSGELFAAIKGANMAFTKSLALSLAPEVRVHCLAPGWIRTAWGEAASDVWQQRVLRETPLGRWGTPADLAHTVRWLVSPAADFLTGQMVRVNGGAVR